MLTNKLSREVKGSQSMSKSKKRKQKNTGQGFVYLSSCFKTR